MTKPILRQPRRDTLKSWWAGCKTRKEFNDAYEREQTRIEQNTFPSKLPDKAYDK